MTRIEDETAVQVAELFALLGDPSRVRILSALLEGELNVGVLAEELGMTDSAISHQMRLLKQMHIVRARKEGRSVFYSLDDAHVTELFQRGLAHVLHR